MENLLKEAKKSLPQVKVEEVRLNEMEKEKLDKIYGNESFKIVNYKKEDFDIARANKLFGEQIASKYQHERLTKEEMKKELKKLNSDGNGGLIYNLPKMAEQKKLSDKDRKKIEKKREKLLEDTKKQYPAGNEYTLNIVKENEQYYNAKIEFKKLALEEIIEFNKEKEDTKINEIIKEKHKDIDFLTNFYDNLQPVLKEDDTYDPETFAYKDKEYQLKYANVIKTEDGKEILDYKRVEKAEFYDNKTLLKHVKSKNTIGDFTNVLVKRYFDEVGFNWYKGVKFTPEYIGKNYLRAKQELNELIGLVEGLREIGELNEFKKVEEYADLCKEAFNSALIANGLKYKEGAVDMLEAASEEETKQAKQKNIEDLKKVAEKFEEARYEDELRKIELRLKRENNENIEKIETLIAGDLEVYKEQKEIVDKLYAKYVESKTLLLTEKNRFEKINYMRDKWKGDISYKAFLNYDEQVIELDKLIYKLNKEQTVIKGIISAVLRKEDLTEKQKEFLHINNLKKYTELEKKYIDILTDVEQMYYRVSDKVFDEKEVREEVDWMCSILKEDMTVNELADIHVKIHEIAIKVRWYKEEYKLDDTAINKFKIKKIEAYDTIARAAALIKTSKITKITLAELFSYEENIIFKGKTEKKLDNSMVEKYAKELYKKGLLQLATVRKEFFSNEELAGEWIKREKADIPVHTNHSNFSNTIKIIKKDYKQEKDLRKAYDKYKEHIAYLQGEKKQYAADHKKVAEINNEIEEYEVMISYLEIVKKLTTDKFYLHGDETKKGDILYRSIDGVDRVPQFANMSENEIFEMSRKLAKGAFEEPTVKEKEEYRKENLKGVEILKANLEQHYLGLYRKYGLAFPSTDYIYEHCEELRKDFSQAQVDDMLSNIEGIFDENIEADKLLLELIAFYRAVSFFVFGTFTYAFTSNLSVGEYDKIRKKIWDANAEKPYRYLKNCEFLHR